MKIPASVLHGMLEPGKATVRREFRCHCSTWPVPAAGCIRAATEEDGLCDGCRDRCGWPGPLYWGDPLWVSETETRRTVPPADLVWPPAHTCLSSYSIAQPATQEVR